MLQLHYAFPKLSRAMGVASFPLTFCWLVNYLPKIPLNFCHVLEMRIGQQTVYFCWYPIGIVVLPHRRISFHWCWIYAQDLGIGNRPSYQDCSSITIVNHNKELAAVLAPSAPACALQPPYHAIWTPLSAELGSWGQTGADGCPLTPRGGLGKRGGRAFSSVT